jgi:hypothetical protein
LDASFQLIYSIQNAKKEAAGLDAICRIRIIGFFEYAVHCTAGIVFMG